jgi:predicted nucleic acid-binding protein
MNGFTFDAGAMIALERGDRRVLALLAEAERCGAFIVVPATALAQAVRNPAKQARLMRLLGHPLTELRALTKQDAVSVGVLLAATRTRDIADAHVVVCAMASGQPIVTSDPVDLRKLSKAVELVVL